MHTVTHLRAALAIAVLGSLPAAMPAAAAITFSRIETRAEVEYQNDRDGTRSELIRSVDIGSFTGLTRPVFTEPSGAPFDTFGAPARLAASQSVFGFNSVAVEGAFANGALNELRAETRFQQGVLAELGDSSALSYNVFAGQIGITCYALTAPTTVAGIVDACHPSIGTVAEVQLRFAVTRGFAAQKDMVDAGLRIEVLADPSSASGTRVDVTQLGATSLTYAFALEDTGSFAPLLVLNIDPLHGVLDAGRVDLGTDALSANYEMSAHITVAGVETGARARIADPFALQADPIAYFHAQFPGAALPGFRLANDGDGDGGGGVNVPAPGPGILAAGLLTLLLVRGGRARACVHRSGQSRTGARCGGKARTGAHRGVVDPPCLSWPPLECVGVCHRRVR